MKDKKRNEEGILKARMVWVDHQKAKAETMERNAKKRAKRTNGVQLNVLSRRRGKSLKETKKLISNIERLHVEDMR